MGKQTEEADPHPIDFETKRFISSMDSLALALDMTMASVRQSHDEAHKRYDSYVSSYAESINRDGKTFIRISSHEYCHDFGILSRELDRIHAASAVVPQSFLVALVSRYDAFLGGIMRALFRMKPEMLKSSERTLSYLQCV